MWFAKKDIVDGRGNDVPLYANRKPCPRIDRFEKDRERRIAHAILRAMWGRYCWKLIVSVILLFPAFMAFPWLIQPLMNLAGAAGAPPLVGAMIGGAIAGFLIVGAVFKVVLQIPVERVAGVLVREQVCPSCLYNLQRLSPQNDGCTLCPECGAAWRILDRTDALVATPQGAMQPNDAGTTSPV